MNTNKHTTSCSLRVSPDLLAVIDDHADREGRSRNQYLVRLITSVLVPENHSEHKPTQMNTDEPLLTQVNAGESELAQVTTNESERTQVNTNEPELTQTNTTEDFVGYDLPRMINFIRKHNQDCESQGLKRSNQRLADAMNKEGYRTTRNKKIDDKFVSKFIHENIPDQAVMKPVQDSAE